MSEIQFTFVGLNCKDSVEAVDLTLVFKWESEGLYKYGGILLNLNLILRAKKKFCKLSYLPNSVVGRGRKRRKSRNPKRKKRRRRRRRRRHWPNWTYWQHVDSYDILLVLFCRLIWQNWLFIMYLLMLLFISGLTTGIQYMQMINKLKFMILWVLILQIQFMTIYTSFYAIMVLTKNFLWPNKFYLVRVAHVATLLFSPWNYDKMEITLIKSTHYFAIHSRRTWKLW